MVSFRFEICSNAIEPNHHYAHLGYHQILPKLYYAYNVSLLQTVYVGTHFLI